MTGFPLLSYNISKFHEFSRVIIKLEFLLMLFSGTVLFIVAPFMMTIFTKDPEVIQLGTTVLRMVAASEPIYGISIIIEGMMLGVGETITPFKFNIFGMWRIR